MEPKYKRVLMKVSGEALAADNKFGLDFDKVVDICKEIKKCVDMGVEMAIVAGGGNFWRGRSSGKMDKTRADHMGMLATVMNSLALADALEQLGVATRVQTAIEMKQIAEQYIRNRAVRHLEKGRVVIFGCGTGNPYFTTDTAATLRAAEIEADILLLAKRIDGVYTADPEKDPKATKIDSLTHMDILSQQLAVMDSTAAAMAMDNKIPILVFGIENPGNIVKAVCGEHIGTIVGII